MSIFGSGSEYSLYVFDLDGTLWRGDEAIPDALEATERLRNGWAQIRYVTNNSSLTLDAYVSKLRKMGFQASVKEVVSSASATASYLQESGSRTIGVIGEPGLVETLRSFALETWSPDDDWPEALDAVAVGIFRSATYTHLAKGMTAIRSGARFIATNADPTFPLEGGRLAPGAGSIVAAVRTCSESEPYVVGKPGPFLTELAMRGTGVSASQTLVVGDRMDTDIASGKAAGCATMLVLTGVTQDAPPGQPFVNTLAELR